MWSHRLVNTVNGNDRSSFDINAETSKVMDIKRHRKTRSDVLDYGPVVIDAALNRKNRCSLFSEDSQGKLVPLNAQRSISLTEQLPVCGYGMKDAAVQVPHVEEGFLRSKSLIRRLFSRHKRTFSGDKTGFKNTSCPELQQTNFTTSKECSHSTSSLSFSNELSPKTWTSNTQKSKCDAAVQTEP